MDCPKCIGHLQRIPLTELFSHAGKGADSQFLLEIDKCFHCSGVWFDRGELETYLAEEITVVDSPSLGKDVDRRMDEAAGTCPRCSVALGKSASVQDTKITIDVCPNCEGIWLDPTEIDRLERANMSGREFLKSIFGALK